MYQVSNAFLNAMKNPVQEHTITGTIGSVSFSEENIVDGSFSISNQSTDTSDVVLGSCYVGQLTAEFVGINIAYGKWINKTITPSFGLKVGEYYEYVPMGVYKVKEAKHTDHGVQVTAYDNMIKFDRKFVKSHFMNLSGMTNIIDQLCSDAGVVCGMSHAQIEALPNGDRTGINIYGSKGKKAEFANDITTLRDLLFWVAQTLGCFATMNRAGQLEFRPYTQTVVDQITEQHRIAGATFADYVTHYIGIYVENLDDNTEDYYGYDATALQQELTETMAEITEDQEDITDLETDRAEWVQKLANHECTQQEYDEAIAEIDAQEKVLTKEINQLTKRVDWLTNAIAQSADDGSDMVLGANPLTMAKNLTTRDQQRREILGALNAISYTPFQASVLCGCIYDLGDVIQWSGGLYNSDTDSFGCVMSYTYTHNGGTELEGFGVDPSVVVVRNKTQKSVDRSSKNAVDATHNQVGTVDPTSGGGGGGGGDDAVPGKDGDLYIHCEGNKTTESISALGGMSLVSSSGNANDGYNATGLCVDDYIPECLAFVFDGLNVGVTYTLSYENQIVGSHYGVWHQFKYCMECTASDHGAAGVLDGTVPTGAGRDAGQKVDITDGFCVPFYNDANNHSYTVSFTATSTTAYVYFHYDDLENTYSHYMDIQAVVKNVKIVSTDNKPVIKAANVGGEWRNIDYVKQVTQTQTSGTEIAEVVNSDGSTTKIYQKDGGLVDDVKVDGTSVVTNKIANINTMTGATAQADGSKGLVPTPTAADSGKYLKGDGTWAEVQGGGGGSVVANAMPDYTNIEVKQPSELPLVMPYDGYVMLVAYRYQVRINIDGNAAAAIYGYSTDISISDLVPCKKGSIITLDWSASLGSGGSWNVRLVPLAYGGGSFCPIVYSTEEREVGVWIDGKPLYQKTYEFENVISVLGNQYTTLVSNPNLNIDSLVYGETSPTKTATFTPISVALTNGDIQGYYTTAWSIKYLTIRYTKTTDVAGSGKYAELGVPAVHYDGTERVIGTWFGKPLYQRTFTGLSTNTNGANWVSVSGITIQNLEEIISCDAYRVSGGGILTKMAIAEFSNNTNNGLQVSVVSSAFNGQIKTVTIQYTKTTD